MKKYVWYVVIAILVIAPLLTACGGQAPSPAPKPTPPAPAPAPAPKPAPAPAPTPTAIPHTLEGRDNCLMCHESGDFAVPADHAGRTNDACTTCHKPAG